MFKNKIIKWKNRCQNERIDCKMREYNDEMKEKTSKWMNKFQNGGIDFKMKE